jgi:hypothetical protein
MEVSENDLLLTPPPAEKPAEKPKDDDKITLSKAEWEAMRRDRDEARDSERYWSGVARGNGGSPQAAPVEEAEEDLDADEFVDEDAPNGELDGDTPEKLVDELAAQGVKALGKRGFITAKDAQRIAVEVAAKVSRQLISRERTKITSDTQIMTEFPDLKDSNSEMFKETARRYQKALALDPNAKKTPAALYLAAQAAAEALKAKAPARPRRDEDDDYEPEGESDRRRRAQAQDSRPRGRAEVVDDDMLGDEARSVIRQMGITEEEFKASQKLTAGNNARRTRR